MQSQGHALPVFSRLTGMHSRSAGTDDCIPISRGEPPPEGTAPDGKEKKLNGWRKERALLPAKPRALRDRAFCPFP